MGRTPYTFAQVRDGLLRLAERRPVRVSSIRTLEPGPDFIVPKVAAQSPGYGTAPIEDVALQQQYCEGVGTDVWRRASICTSRMRR